MKGNAMAHKQMLAEVFASNLEMLKMTLADFSDADMLVRAVPKANHALWQLGHLVNSEVTLVGTSVPGSMPALPAGFDTLTTEQALVDVISKYKTFFLPIQHRHLDRVGWTVHGAQTAACTSLRIQLQEAAQAGWVKLSHCRVVLGRRPVEQATGYI